MRSVAPKKEGISARCGSRGAHFYAALGIIQYPKRSRTVPAIMDPEVGTTDCKFEIDSRLDFFTKTAQSVQKNYCMLVKNITW